MKGGEVRFDFTGNTKELEKDTKSLGSKVSSVGKSIGVAFVKGAAVAGSALSGLVALSVKGFSDMEQLSGGAKKIFDEMDYSKIEKDATNAYKNMNMSATEYLEAMNNVGATFASTMGDQKGYDTAKAGLQAISDYATGTGADINTLTDKYKMITRSTSSYLSIADQFAGLLPQTTSGFLEQAQASGYLSSAYKKLTDVPVEEYQQAITKMLEKGVADMGLAGNTLAETEDTLSGSILAAKSAFSNFVSGAGDIQPVIDTFVTAGTNIANAVGEMAPKVIDGLVELVDAIIPKIPKLIKSLLPSVLKGIIKLTSGILTVLPEIIQTLASMLPTILTGIISTFTTLLPTLISSVIQSVSSIAQAIVQSIPLLVASIPVIIMGLCTGLMQALPDLVLMAPQIIVALITGIMQALPMLIETVPTMINQFADAIVNCLPRMITMGGDMIKSLWSGIKNIFNSLPAWLKSFVQNKIIAPIRDKGVNGLKEVGVNLVKGLWAGMGNAKDWFLNKVKSFGKSVLKSIKNVLGVHSPSTEFAWIGKMNVLGLEEGMENMKGDLNATMDDMFSLSPNLVNNASTHFNPSYNIVVNNNMKQDPLGRMVRDIKTFAGGSKNDYNYVGA